MEGTEDYVTGFMYGADIKGILRQLNSMMISNGFVCDVHGMLGVMSCK